MKGILVLGEIRPYKKEKCSPFEQFMIEVAMLLGCLPSFASPTLDDGNSHIKKRVEQLLKIEEKYNKALDADLA
ncbi:MAG: hypothetical protein KKD77_20445 [Gammaproteobacteria bacterium]|nr:hypothetical protein [Gammaproteobacteria bacterium]